MLVAVVLLITLGGCGMTHVSDTRRDLIEDDPPWRQRLIKDEPAAANGDLKVTLGATYKSRNMWRGFDWYAKNHSAIQPSIDIDFWGTGFGANILWSRANGGGFENKQWLVYSPYYRNSLWQGERYQTDYKFGWRYYNGPDGPMADHFCHPRDSDFQEFFGRFSWPGACDDAIVPYYECARIKPDDGGRRRSGAPKSYWRTFGGWFHTFGLYKDWKVSGFLPDTSEQTIRTSFEMVYNDAAGPTPDSRRDKADHDWSHAVFGLSTDFLYKGLTFTPGVHFQKSMDDSVNTSDELWFTFSTKFTF